MKKLELIFSLFFMGLILSIVSCSTNSVEASDETISDSINTIDSIGINDSNTTINQDTTNLGISLPTNIDLKDWSSLTHEKLDVPNYSVVFPQDKVLRFDITISKTNWEIMQNDLEENLGSSMARPGPPDLANEDPTVSDDDYKPIWVPCSFKFNGKEWYSVGIRYKGNSSLQSAYQSGNKKLSFKLDFDQFEDEIPEIKNQRFYGFKQLNLNNNFDDVSLMREKIGADLFREFGLVSAQTSYCVIYLNNGIDTAQYYGVYTIVEEVDNTVIENQLLDDSGNLYKPDGDAASFAYGTYNEDEMVKKNNEDEADYSDVKALYDIINSSERTTDVESWKTKLESIFDVDIFLKWLAANTAIQNWDTYGIMTHNYYLYNNPANNLLTWIPWDNNEAFQDGKQGGALSLSLDEVGEDWPLIRYIIDIDEYREKYNSYLKSFIDEVFTIEATTAKYDKYYSLLKEYAYLEESGYSFLNSPTDFDAGVEALKLHVQNRHDAVNSYLGISE